MTPRMLGHYMSAAVFEYYQIGLDVELLLSPSDAQRSIGCGHMTLFDNVFQRKVHVTQDNGCIGVQDGKPYHRLVDEGTGMPIQAFFPSRGQFRAPKNPRIAQDLACAIRSIGYLPNQVYVALPDFAFSEITGVDNLPLQDFTVVDDLHITLSIKPLLVTFDDTFLLKWVPDPFSQGMLFSGLVSNGKKADLHNPAASFYKSITSNSIPMLTGTNMVPYTQRVVHPSVIHSSGPKPTQAEPSCPQCGPSKVMFDKGSHWKCWWCEGMVKK